MAADRVIYTFPEYEGGRVELVGAGTAGRAHPQSWSYKLVRSGLYRARVVLAPLSREDMGRLGEAIVREVLGS